MSARVIQYGALFYSSDFYHRKKPLRKVARDLSTTWLIDKPLKITIPAIKRKILIHIKTPPAKPLVERNGGIFKDKLFVFCSGIKASQVKRQQSYRYLLRYQMVKNLLLKLNISDVTPYYTIQDIASETFSQM